MTAKTTLNTRDLQWVPAFLTEDGETFQEVQLASPTLVIAHVQRLLDGPDPNLADAVALLALAAGDLEFAPFPELDRTIPVTGNERTPVQRTRR